MMQRLRKFLRICWKSLELSLLRKFLDAEIEDLIQKRQEARANRDFATADQIRDQLAAQGIKLLDTKDGVRWTCD